MLYTIYKVSNIINGKVYIGKHQTLNINDRYLGSGKALKQAILKYGRASFIKEILFIFDNEQDMNIKEKELVTFDFINSENNYNCGIGGEGGAQFKGRLHSEESKKKIANSSLNRKHSEETKLYLSLINSSKIFSDDTRKKISESKKNKILINNGSIAKMIDKDLPIPNGWVKGKLDMGGKYLEPFHKRNKPGAIPGYPT